MENVIIILVVALILGLAVGYIWKSKKQGKKCIGCPDGGSCSCGSSGSCGGGCGCSCGGEK